MFCSFQIINGARFSALSALFTALPYSFCYPRSESFVRDREFFAHFFKLFFIDGYPLFRFLHKSVPGFG